MMNRGKNKTDLRYNLTRRRTRGNNRRGRSVWDRLQISSSSTERDVLVYDDIERDLQDLPDYEPRCEDQTSLSSGQSNQNMILEPDYTECDDQEEREASVFQFSRESMDFECKPVSEKIHFNPSCDVGKIDEGCDVIEKETLNELEEGEIEESEEAEVDEHRHKSNGKAEMTPKRGWKDMESHHGKKDSKTVQNKPRRRRPERPQMNSFVPHDSEERNNNKYDNRETKKYCNQSPAYIKQPRGGHNRTSEEGHDYRPHDREYAVPDERTIGRNTRDQPKGKRRDHSFPRTERIPEKHRSNSEEHKDFTYQTRLKKNDESKHFSRTPRRSRSRETQAKFVCRGSGKHPYYGPNEEAGSETQGIFHRTNTLDERQFDDPRRKSETGRSQSSLMTRFPEHSQSRNRSTYGESRYGNRKRTSVCAELQATPEKRICLRTVSSSKLSNNYSKERTDTNYRASFQQKPAGRHKSGFLGTVAFLRRPYHQPDDVALTLANRSDELDNYLRSNEKCPLIVQLMGILRRCAEATLCQQNKLKVMYALRASKVFERKDVLEKLKEIQSSVAEDIKDDFTFCLLFVMKTMVQTVGLEEGDTIIAVSLMQRIIQDQDDELGRQKELLKEIEDLFHKKVDMNADCDDMIIHFAQTLPILPNVEQIRSSDKINIPKHSIGKAFYSDQWYVAYMYVLFREDFVRPLMSGIKAYISYQERGTTERFYSTDVKLYKNVYLVSTSTQIENGVVWKIQFQSNFSRRSYIPSVLQYGSLLCLSHDGFKSIHFATVANRDLSELRKGQVDIKFVDRFDVPHPLEETFVMLESKAFYGAYSHTLMSLQRLARELAYGETTLSMGKYLTGQTNEIGHPAYLDTYSTFSFRCLKHYGQGSTQTNSLEFPTVVRKFDTWPSASELGLDLSQYEALKLVLTSEVAMIQGPPGTGKTMMGIRIAELLLSNKSQWDAGKHSFPELLFCLNMGVQNDQGPLLLVSYTNHALDQFLQLLINTPTLDHCQPEDVVRVGSRCEVQELDKYALKRHRRNQPSTPYKACFGALRDIGRRVEALKTFILDYQSNLIHEDIFFEKGVIKRDHYRQLKGRGYFERNLPENNTLLWVWLELQSFLFATENYLDDAGFNENAVTMDDLVREDMERLLDDVDDDAIPFMNYINQRAILEAPIKAIDITTDSFYERLTRKQCNMILKGIHKELQMRDRMSFQEMAAVQNIWELSIQDRWKMYRYWVHAATEPLFRKLRFHENEFEVASLRYIEARNHLDCQIMKNAHIVAMTTTAAARYTAVLREVGAPVVIIEEAAQVSEQHVLGSLSPACQHLIMIGDHQQLKPAYNDYKLAKAYNTDVSLFERLVHSKVPFQQLKNQHRMRPEISRLLVPHIYKTLNDDPSVFAYPSIRGVASSVFFVSHIEMEDMDDESLSHSNMFEAEFLTKLYRHLRLQGYSSSEITVLAPYKDQVQQLRRLIREMEKSDLAGLKDLNADTEPLETQTQIEGLKNDTGVRITPVDNFQGEENRIILLSLVRSNKSGRIGYLSAANRVCVSLSRAKEGLYVIGNFTCLRKASPLWAKIVSKAEEKGICGKSLELKCLKHPSHKMIVESAKDFEAFKDGGCSQPCDARLDCGHTCSRRCHTDDPEHITPCQKRCIKHCPRNHPHERNCDQPIGNCREEIEVVLPTCGHKVTTKCFKDIGDVKCMERCLNMLPCGHVCQRYCSDKCNTEKDCNELVKVTKKCGHIIQIACSTQKSGLCTVKCSATLECGHECKGTCGECHSGRLHKPCRKKCERKLICGHPCNADCTAACPPCQKKCQIICAHNRCKMQCGTVCHPCREPCKWECRKDCKNGFKCTRLCCENCNRERCNTPCSRKMPCGHRCIALKCEKCFCRECSDKSEFEIFFGTEDETDAVFHRLRDCGHIFEVTSLDMYMDGDTSSETIAMKVCPRCTSPIWNSERYGNAVRQRQKDIDDVKSKFVSGKVQMEWEKRNLHPQISKIKDDEHQSLFNDFLKKTANIAQIDILRMQIGFYSNVRETMDNLEIIRNDYINQDQGSELTHELNSLLSWVLLKRFRFSEQELREFKAELTRIRLCNRTLMMQSTLSKKDDVPEEDRAWVNKTTYQLCSGSKMAEQEVDSLELKLKELETQYPRSGLMVTEEERIMILKAMNFSQKGHWYKCKNGHVYAIGDCGGATVESRCPECNETIGGGSHRLREDNSVASEMDGAQFSAWSEQANMENYIL